VAVKVEELKMTLKVAGVTPFQVIYQETGEGKSR